MMARSSDYMNEVIQYGNTTVLRGWALAQLIEIAKTQGHANPRQMADRWM